MVIPGNSKGPAVGGKRMVSYGVVEEMMNFRGGHYLYGVGGSLNYHDLQMEFEEGGALEVGR